MATTVKTATVGFSTTRAGKMENSLNSYVKELKDKFGKITIGKNNFKNAVKGNKTYTDFIKYLDTLTNTVGQLIDGLGTDYKKRIQEANRRYKTDEANKMFFETK